MNYYFRFIRFVNNYNYSYNSQLQPGNNIRYPVENLFEFRYSPFVDFANNKLKTPAVIFVQNPIIFPYLVQQYVAS